MSRSGPTKGRFEQIFSRGQRAQGRWLRLFCIPGSGKAGFATPKSLKTKPRRNRLKRRMKEAWHAALSESQTIAHAYDWVAAGRGEAEQATLSDLSRELSQLMGALHERWSQSQASTDESASS